MSRMANTGYINEYEILLKKYLDTRNDILTPMLETRQVSKLKKEIVISESLQFEDMTVFEMTLNSFAFTKNGKLKNVDDGITDEVISKIDHFYTCITQCHAQILEATAMKYGNLSARFFFQKTEVIKPSTSSFKVKCVFNDIESREDLGCLLRDNHLMKDDWHRICINKPDSKLVDYVKKIDEKYTDYLRINSLDRIEENENYLKENIKIQNYLKTINAKTSFGYDVYNYSCVIDTRKLSVHAAIKCGQFVVCGFILRGNKMTTRDICNHLNQMVTKFLERYSEIEIIHLLYTKIKTCKNRTWNPVLNLKNGYLSITVSINGLDQENVNSDIWLTLDEKQREKYRTIDIIDNVKDIHIPLITSLIEHTEENYNDVLLENSYEKSYEILENCSCVESLKSYMSKQICQFINSLNATTYIRCNFTKEDID